MGRPFMCRLGLLRPIIVVSLFVFNLNAIAGIALDTKISLIRPGSDSKCDTLQFSGTLGSFSSKVFSDLSAQMTRDFQLKDPAKNRVGLSVDLIRRGVSYANLKLEGKSQAMAEVERRFLAGTEIKMTEFKACFEADPSLILIQLATLFPQQLSTMINPKAKIQLLQKSDSGSCTVARETSLEDLIHMYLPSASLIGRIPSVSFLDGGVSQDGDLVTKVVTISFLNPDMLFLPEASIQITTHSESIYTVIDRLSKEDGALKVSGSFECTKAAGIGAVWIQDLKVTHP